MSEANLRDYLASVFTNIEHGLICQIPPLYSDLSIETLTYVHTCLKRATYVHVCLLFANQTRSLQ